MMNGPRNNISDGPMGGPLGLPRPGGPGPGNEGPIGPPPPGNQTASGNYSGILNGALPAVQGMGPANPAPQQTLLGSFLNRG